jgi:hypothetical protein
MVVTLLIASLALIAIVVTVIACFAKGPTQVGDE